MQFEPRLVERVRGRFGGRVSGGRDIAHPSPDVDLVRRLGADEVVAVIGRLVRRTQRAVVRLLVRSDMANRVGVGEKPGESRLRARLFGGIGRDRSGERRDWRRRPEPGDRSASRR